MDSENNKKFDFLGNEVNIGDEVVFMQLQYRSLMKGKIIKMTNKKVYISHEQTNTCSKESIQRYDQIIKIKWK